MFCALSLGAPFFALPWLLAVTQDWSAEEEMSDAISAGMEVIKEQCRGLRMFAEKVRAHEMRVLQRQLLLLIPEQIFNSTLGRFIRRDSSKIVTSSKVQGQEQSYFCDLVEIVTSQLCDIEADALMYSRNRSRCLLVSNSFARPQVCAENYFEW